MSSVYNENDEYAAEWLRNLIAAGHIAPGDVDTRSIVDIGDDDYRSYTQVHLFAGIGGWSLAARLAGWPDDRRLWTGSCPCQPFSGAGKRKGTADARHLWPEMRRLVSACRPPVVAGEQVASKDGRVWLDGVRTDLEDMAYAVWAADTCAAGVGSPHIRQRLYWLADSSGAGRRALQRPSATDGRSSIEPDGHSAARGLADDDDSRQSRLADSGLQRQQVHDVDGRGELVGMADDEVIRRGQGCSDAGRRGEGTSASKERLRSAERSDAERMADADGGLAGHGGLQPGRQHGQQPQDGRVGGLGDASGARSGRHTGTVPGAQGESAGERFGAGHQSDEPVAAGATGRLVDADQPGPQGRHDGPAEGGRIDQRSAGPPSLSSWSTYDIVHCTDGKARRFEPGSFPLAHGVSGRVGRLRAYGNAIVPQVAAEVLRAFLDGE